MAGLGEDIQKALAKRRTETANVTLRGKFELYPDGSYAVHIDGAQCSWKFTTMDAAVPFIKGQVAAAFADLALAGE